jgi:uncharacterized membrane protein YeaQ/YmgE (transglycosylase-associated protein family)
MLASVVGWVLFGLMAGAVARVIHPGFDRMGYLGAILLGITGSLIGVGAAFLLGYGASPTQGAGWVLSILGAVALCTSAPARAASAAPSDSQRGRNLYAVFERMHDRITFAGRIASGYRGQWREDVTLAPLPRGLDGWPEGRGWPDRVVGVAVADANFYRVFTYLTDLEGSGFRSTGMSFGGVLETFPAPI